MLIYCLFKSCLLYSSHNISLSSSLLANIWNIFVIYKKSQSELFLEKFSPLLKIINDFVLHSFYLKSKIVFLDFFYIRLLTKIYSFSAIECEQQKTVTLQART